MNECYKVTATVFRLSYNPLKKCSLNKKNFNGCPHVPYLHPSNRKSAVLLWTREEEKRRTKSHHRYPAPSHLLKQRSFCCHEAGQWDFLRMFYAPFPRPGRRPYRLDLFSSRLAFPWERLGFPNEFFCDVTVNWQLRTWRFILHLLLLFS